MQKMNSTFEEGFGFRVCRICLSSDSKGEFSQLFAKGNESLASIFINISGFNLSSDRNKNDILICDDCSNQLKNVLVLKMEMHIAEELYFRCKREEKLRQENEVKIKTEKFQAIAVMAKQEIGTDDDEWEDIEIEESEWETSEDLSGLKEESLPKDATFLCSKPLSKKCEDYAWNNREHSECANNFQQYRCNECPMEFSNKSDIAEHYEFDLHIPDYSPMKTKFDLRETTSENSIDIDSGKSSSFRYFH